MTFPNISKSGAGFFFERLKTSIAKQRLATEVSPWSLKSKVNFTVPDGKRRWGANVVRLDGIYFGTFGNTPSGNRLNSIILKSLERSDSIIFQSNYSHELVTKYFGNIEKPYEIILNGAPINSRQITRSYKSDKPFVFICIAKWRNFKRLDAIIKTIDLINNEVLTELIVVGDVPAYSNFPERANIQFVGDKSQIEIYELLKNAHALIHLAWFDACPNSVVEAVCSGLPVICSNLGGTKEIVSMAKAGIISQCDSIIGDYSDVDLDNPPLPNFNILVDDCMKLINSYNLHVTQMNIDKLDINSTARKYINVAMKTREL